MRAVGRRSLIPAAVAAIAVALASSPSPARADPGVGSSPACPATRPAQAGAPSVGAPSAVHAIAGDGSDTVTWCAPARGQSRVTGYVVTASDGTTSTAAVPNSYVIATVPNGRAESFTVRAVTADGRGPSSAASNAVTAAPRPGPRDVLRGAPQSVAYDRYSVSIGGRRTVIYAGEFDPWRLNSPSLWLDRLQKMKADGYNAVTPYFDWDTHSAAPGRYDFSGIRDVNAFLNIAQQVGLYVIARPGPYVNAETDGGGFPGWLTTQSGVARTDAPDFVAASDQWLSAIDPIIAAHQITRGGDVILYQIENELYSRAPASERYMEELRAKAHADGIDVPLIGNEGDTFEGTPGNPDLPGYDSYPLGFDCANPSGFGQPPTFTAEPGKPLSLPEYQAGSYDNWGGAGYANCYHLTGPDFESVFYKDNLSQGTVLQSNYMAVGDTNWGWLPAPFMYSSYDYGAGIMETGELGTPEHPGDLTASKYAENKLIGDFAQAVPSLAQTDPATAPVPDNPLIAATARANPQDGTTFVYLRQADATSTADASTRLTGLSVAGDRYATVPQQPGTAITLRGRDAKLLVAGDRFAGQQLQYSTSELMTQAAIDDRAVALLYGRDGTAGETVLRYASRPQVSVDGGPVQSHWDATRGDLRLDYVHHGLAEVTVTGGGRPPLVLLLASTQVAGQFWPESTAAGPVLVRAPYLVRSAAATGDRLSLTGDTSAPGSITVWAPAAARTVSWNGRALATSARADGSLTASLPGPAAVNLPALSGWRFRAETPEAQPGFDDSGWTLADHPTTTNPTKPVTTPVLFADDYGFHRGFVWYRGRFVATGRETGITLTAGEGTHGAFSVWLNGVLLGSDTAGAEAATRTFRFPAAALRPGGRNVVSVLVQSSGHDEDGVYSAAQPPGDGHKAPRGLLGATLTGATPPVTWRLQGNRGGETLLDPARGTMNTGGLYGADAGWALPGYPDRSWEPVSLPDSWTARGVPAGIGWYRTTFRLSQARGQYAPLWVQLGGAGPGPGEHARERRAFVYVNGWLIGQYDDALGPQHRFYVPAGILHGDGTNTIAIASWDLDGSSGGLPAVSLAPAGLQAGGVDVSDVAAPGYDPSVDGRPQVAAPTLAASASPAVVTPGRALTVTATLSDPGGPALRDATVALRVPDGWSATPTGPVAVGDVGPGAQVTRRFRVLAPASLPASEAGSTPLVAVARFRRGGSRQRLLGDALVEVPEPSLAASFDNVGVTDDSDRTPTDPFDGFDGEGTTFSAQGLAGAGVTPGATVSAGGLSFTWPSAAAGTPDNTMAEGQVIAVGGSGRSLGFLAAANNAALTGTGTVYYSDGSSAPFTLDVGNFYYAAGTNGNPANTVAITDPTLNYPDSTQAHDSYVFEQTVAIDPSKTVAAVRLPSLGDVSGYNPALHVFAVTVG